MNRVQDHPYRLEHCQSSFSSAGTVSGAGRSLMMSTTQPSNGRPVLSEDEAAAAAAIAIDSDIDSTRRITATSQCK